MTDPKRPEDADELAPDDSDAAHQSADEAEAADQLDDTDADDFDRAGDAELSESEFVSGATPAGRPATPMSSRDRAAADRAAAKLPPAAGSDELPYVDDRVSKIWVGAIAATFILIMLYGLFLGDNGFLVPAPTPAPTISPAPSVSISPSASPVTSASPAPSGTTGASQSPGVSPSASESPQTSASPAVTLHTGPTSGPT